MVEGTFQSRKETLEAKRLEVAAMPLMSRRYKPNKIPTISIFVQHSKGCQYKNDPSYKRCRCWKHLRWREWDLATGKTKQRTEATGERTWDGAVRARQFKEESFRRTKDGRKKDFESITVQQAIETYLDEKQGQEVDAAVVKRHRLQLERMEQFCSTRGSALLRDVSLQDLAAFRSTWPTFYPAAGTRVLSQSIMKAFFKFCVAADLLNKNPAEGLKAITREQIPTLPLDPEQFEKLLAAVPVACRAGGVISREDRQRRMRSFLLCQRHTGTAISDTVRLKRSQVTIEDGVTRITYTRLKRRKGKTPVIIVVPIRPEIAAELLATPNKDPEYFFLGAGTKNLKHTVTRWARAIKKVFEAAGMPEGHSHQLRDTAAVEWLKAGVPLYEVSKLLGHTSIKTTEQHYAPWVKSLQNRVASVLIGTWHGNSKQDHA